jgi:hypothetical protein
VFVARCEALFSQKLFTHYVGIRCRVSFKIGGLTTEHAHRHVGAGVRTTDIAEFTGPAYYELVRQVSCSNYF